MSLSDEFSTYVADLLDGRYDCVDRIVLNGYFLMGQTSGGFLTWWNQLCPGAPLDQKRLEQMAGDFSRRLHAFAKKANIPVIHCLLGEKPSINEPRNFYPRTPPSKGSLPFWWHELRRWSGRPGGTVRVSWSCGAKRLGHWSSITIFTFWTGSGGT